MRSEQKKDFDTLHRIYKEINRICKEHKINSVWKVDDGDFETRIDINADGKWMKGNGTLPEKDYEMFCPDLIDFQHKLIVEFEENAQPNSGYMGAKLNKGHFPELLNKRDETRDYYYEVAGFRLFKIWQIDMKTGTFWKQGLYNFLKSIQIYQ